MSNKRKHIALIGNPNCGKSTLFNRLTGLRQKTSNLPGTTVEQKKGIWDTPDASYELMDLPGIYSLYTHSQEEKVVVEKLLGLNKKQKPDQLLFVLDASNLRRNLLLFSQVSELGIPAVAVITMADTAKKRGIEIDLAQLSKELGIPVARVNPRFGDGLSAIAGLVTVAAVSSTFPPRDHSAGRLHEFAQNKEIRGLAAETLLRYKQIEQVVSASTTKTSARASITRRFDRIFTHRIWGFLVFAIVMLTIFQGVFTLAEYPMAWIERGFAQLSTSAHLSLPANFWGNLVADGIIPGLAGVLVFLPQIAILFFFISLLEDSGYMVRASFITDKLMRRIGLNGRSVIPLMGGFACAIPAIMASRSIKNRKERIATMFVIPLMSCSARLPVYVLLISLAVPAGTRIGPVGVQSLVMTLAYFSGIILAFIISKVLFMMRNREKEISEFIMELPPYQLPRLENVWKTVWYKSRSFVTEAGKIIMLIAVVLWFLSSHGPGDRLEKAAKQASINATGLTPTEKEAAIGAAKLEASYAGMMGKWIEPAITPLGYDWKTGIAIISSFAAREVFVGTMNTLFQSGGDGDVRGIREKMQASRNPKTGEPLYGVGYAFSLIIFYAFALQCMSTMAVMRRESGGWKLPIIQFFLFGGIAYIAAFLINKLVILLM